MNTKDKNPNSSYTKRMVMDVIKVLLFLLVFSTLFHNQLAGLVDSISDFSYHHYFITTFVVLLLLAIVIESDVFHGDHITQMKEKWKKNSDNQKIK
jgi:hypothetical protein